MQENDVIISTVGTIGNCAVITKDLLPANSDRHVGIIRPKNISAYFLSTFLLTKYGRMQSSRNIVGNVQPNLYIRDMKKFILPTLPQSFQLQIKKIVKLAHQKQAQSKKLYKEAEELLLKELGLLDYEVEHTLSFVTTKKEINQFINESRRTEKQNLKEEIDNLKWELIEATLEEQGKTDKLEEIKELRHKNVKPFFIWKLEFSDVFKEKRGFDVVIGNLPYVKEYTEKNAFNGLRDSQYYMGKMDLWYFFACMGLDLLKKNGVQAFIAPNNWISNFGAKLMRNKLIKESKIHEFIDFGNYKIFDTAGIQTMVYLLEKTLNNDSYSINYARLHLEKPNPDELTQFLESKNR